MSVLEGRVLCPYLVNAALKAFARALLLGEIKCLPTTKGCVSEDILLQTHNLPRGAGILRFPGTLCVREQVIQLHQDFPLV